jgi:biotin carboxylase
MSILGKPVDPNPPSDLTAAMLVQHDNTGRNSAIAGTVMPEWTRIAGGERQSRAATAAPSASDKAARPLAGQNVLFLPGGRWQVDAIQLLQRLGARVVCADGTESPAAAEVADIWVRTELQDVDALCRLAQQHDVRAVLTDQTDFAVPLVAEVAERLGLVGLPKQIALDATNKGRMRDKLEQQGIIQPEYRVCTSEESFRHAVRELGLPLFHKPVDAQSSRGVGALLEKAVVHNWRDTLGAAFRHSAAASATRTVIVERLIHGIECTVEGFVFDDGPRTVAISSKSHYADLPGVARTLTYPAALSSETAQRVARTNEQVIQSLGIPFGITHAEFIVDAAGTPWLVEIAARGGGSGISSRIVPAVTGFEPVQGLIAQLLGERVTCPPLDERAAELRFLRLEQGRRLAETPNLDALRAREGVIELFLQHRPGDWIPAVGDDRSRHGFVITAAATRAEAVRVAESVENEFACIYHRGAA